MLSATVYRATKLLTRWKTNNIRLKALQTAVNIELDVDFKIYANADKLEVEAVIVDAK